MSYRINATRDNRSFDIDDGEDDVQTLLEAREWAQSRIRDLTPREQIGLSVWIDEHAETGGVRCVEHVATGVCEGRR